MNESDFVFACMLAGGLGFFLIFVAAVMSFINWISDSCESYHAWKRKRRIQKMLDRMSPVRCKHL